MGLLQGFVCEKEDAFQLALSLPVAPSPCPKAMPTAGQERTRKNTFPAPSSHPGAHVALLGESVRPTGQHL